MPGTLPVASSAELADSSRVQKFVRYALRGDTAYGLVEGNSVRQIRGDLFGDWEATQTTYDLGEVDILVPTEPAQVIALAGNYRDHLGDTPPHEFPQPFFKPVSCLLPHEGLVVQPGDHPPVHYEAELVIVIGKRAHKVPVESAMDYVLGVTCGNDISARQWQSQDVQWWRAKGSDTFGPCGPFIASGLDYDNLQMTLRVNGQIRQQTSTSRMVHGVAETVSFVSQYVTLEPGDLIFTGTTGQTQGMQVGDVVEVEIEGVGRLRNTLIAEPNTLTEAEREAGWRLLFDGRTFDGWRGYKMDAMPPGWQVLDGAMVRVTGGAGGKGAGGGDDLITTEQFENFELTLEWKIVPGGNSGVLWRVTEDAVTSWHTAPEMQVLDNAAYPGRDKRQLAGSCYDLYAAQPTAVRAAGHWNQVRVVADGPRIEHWLNGRKVAAYEVGSPDWRQRVAASKFAGMPRFARATRGHICLQDHTSRVAFRSIKLRVLEGSSKLFPAQEPRP